MRANFIEDDYMYNFASNALKCWRLPLFFFVVFFVVSFYSVNQGQDRYCDEALVVLGTVGDYLDKEIMIEDPYVTASSLNVDISGTDKSISGTAKANIYAFDFSTRRVITVKLKGDNPRTVRVALEKMLTKLSGRHDERYALAVASYDARLSFLKKTRTNLEKMISTLSSDKSIPAEAYQNLQVELIKIKGVLPPPPTPTRIVMPDSAEAKLCETKTILERVLFSVGWGIIGSLMVMFGLHLGKIYCMRWGKK